MNIGFTGHRDRVCADEELDRIHNLYPNSVWVHGGAIGFDYQVEKYARLNHIDTIIYPPKYNVYGKQAPLVRNREILADSELLIACWDGRRTGGTYYTIRQARELNKEIIFVKVRDT